MLPEGEILHDIWKHQTLVHVDKSNTYYILENKMMMPLHFLQDLLIVAGSLTKQYQYQKLCFESLKTQLNTFDSRNDTHLIHDQGRQTQSGTKSLNCNLPDKLKVSRF